MLLDIACCPVLIVIGSGFKSFLFFLKIMRANTILMQNPIEDIYVPMSSAIAASPVKRDPHLATFNTTVERKPPASIHSTACKSTRMMISVHERSFLSIRSLMFIYRSLRSFDGSNIEKVTVASPPP